MEGEVALPCRPQLPLAPMGALGWNGPLEEFCLGTRVLTPDGEAALGAFNGEGGHLKKPFHQHSNSWGQVLQSWQVIQAAPPGSCHLQWRGGCPGGWRRNTNPGVRKDLCVPFVAARWREYLRVGVRRWVYIFYKVHPLVTEHSGKLWAASEGTASIKVLVFLQETY